MEETGGVGGRVAGITRFPVKSMLGEQLEEAELTSRGLVGDRVYAVVDRSDGKVASAKAPRRWGRLLEFSASFVDAPTATSHPPVELTFPDGTGMRSDDGAIDGALSRFFDRDVVLTSEVPEDRRLDEVWPDIDGLAPDEFIESTRLPDTEDGLAVSEVPMGLAAPGTFFDLAPIHLLTTSTLAALEAANPAGSFDARRFRPNLLVDTDQPGFLENDWAGMALTSGEIGLTGMMPVMRCVMTTLAQRGLEADRSTLDTVAAVNRIEIPGLGTWACAGLYAGVAVPGTVRVGDQLSTVASPP